MALGTNYLIESFMSLLFLGKQTAMSNEVTEISTSICDVKSISDVIQLLAIP